MENTQENKAKFFAQYWGQNVLKVKMQDDYIGQQINSAWINSFGKPSYLELKPLSQITDEDALAVFRFHYPENLFDKSINEYDAEQAVDWLKYNYNKPGYIHLTAEGADYLRLRGYAIDWNGISVEQQIEWGWVKLNE